MITNPFARDSWIGFILATTGGLVTGLGVNLQRMAHDNREKNSYLQVVWWYICFLDGNFVLR